MTTEPPVPPVPEAQPEKVEHALNRIADFLTAPAPEVKEEAGEMPWMKTFRVLHDIHAALNPTLNPDPAKAADEARNLVWSLINEVDLYASKEITIATAPIPEPSEPQTPVVARYRLRRAAVEEAKNTGLCDDEVIPFERGFDDGFAAGRRSRS